MKTADETVRVPDGGPANLRDWFGGIAMQAMMTNPDYLQVVTKMQGLPQDLVAAKAFEYADAMLKARQP